MYDLTTGDPVLDTHPSIVNAVVHGLEKKSIPYPSVDGLPELRCLAAEWMNTTCGTRYACDNVLVTCGGKFALFALLSLMLQPGDEVLIPSPYWASYPHIVRTAGGVASILCSGERGWKITKEDLIRHANGKSRVLLLNNACNPTGVLYSREELYELLETAKKLSLTVISDEVYSGLIYDSTEFISCGSFPEYEENVAIVQSCSKNFAMTGWRVGFVMGPERLVKALAVFQGQSATGTALPSQWAAIGALENATEVNAYVRNAMRRRRDLFVHLYNDLFSASVPPPQSGLYLFAPLSSCGLSLTGDSALFCEQMKKCAHVALVPGAACGQEGYVRCAFSEPEETIEKALPALQRAVLRLLEGSL